MMKKRDFFQTIKPFAITQPWNGKQKKNEILPAYPTLFRSTTTGTNYYAKKMSTQFILTFLLAIADAMWCLTNAKLIFDVYDLQSKPRLTKYWRNPHILQIYLQVKLIYEMSFSLLLEFNDFSLPTPLYYQPLALVLPGDVNLERKSFSSAPDFLAKLDTLTVA